MPKEKKSPFITADKTIFIRSEKSAFLFNAHRAASAALQKWIGIQATQVNKEK